MGLAEVGESFAVGIEAQDNPVAISGDKLFPAWTPEGSTLIPYFGTHELDGSKDPNIVGVLKINCGMLRDEGNYFEIGFKAVKAAGLEGKVAVFALGPRTDVDISAEHHIDGLPDNPELRQRFAYWTTRGAKVQNWKNGDNAIGPVPISWYAVHDQFEDVVCSSKQFPNLEWMSDVGNSAQGQANQRRTAVGIGPDPAVVRERGILIRRVDSNGGTNLFFDDWRPRPIAPEDRELVRQWRCGFGNAPEFVTQQGATPQQFLGRFALGHYIAIRGEEDNKPTIGSEVHLAAIVQDPEDCEPNRFQRGKIWADYMVRLFSRHGLINAKAFAGNGLTEVGGSFNFLPVPAVDHGALGMFTSDVGLTALFGSLEEVHRLSMLQ
ncbi:MAG TPA: hypothetical protein VGS08_00165 [Candidatus Saccharimonadales bacterium]|nr:hypothetical protein [Candidatus Saccharimonadales bacterium]